MLSSTKSNQFRPIPAARVDGVIILALLLAAGLLFGLQLGELPLRDWDEGIVAQVARSIWQSQPGEQRWLFPQLGSTPYLNKPTLLHTLIAGSFALAGETEAMARLPGAILTALSVPLLYGIGRELFPRRLTAVFAALVYLTSLPVVRHGRLAMLDGAVLCFLCFLIWCALRSRRDLRWALGIGIGFGAIFLTKGILAILLVAIALIFLAWDTPRLLVTPYLWIGFALGSAPVAAWYIAQWLHYGDRVGGNLMHHSVRRIWDSVESNDGPPWYYLLEMLKYAWPWLIFLPQGLRSIWENRHLSWARLLLAWYSIYFIAISVMGTKLPWYILPIYPAFALVVGVQCDRIWQQPPNSQVPRAWIFIIGCMALVGWAGIFYFSSSGPDPSPIMQIAAIAIGITMTTTAILMHRSDRQFLPVLIWGSYVSLLLFVCSHSWIWELSAQYPVKPVATILRQQVPAQTMVYTTDENTRPSLDFYSQRPVEPATPDRIREIWKQLPSPYLLTTDIQTLLSQE